MCYGFGRSLPEKPHADSALSWTIELHQQDGLSLAEIFVRNSLLVKRWQLFTPVALRHSSSADTPAYSPMPRYVLARIS
jgi:hypothetical protein